MLWRRIFWSEKDLFSTFKIFHHISLGPIWCHRLTGLTCERRFCWCSALFVVSGAKSFIFDRMFRFRADTVVMQNCTRYHKEILTTNCCMHNKCCMHTFPVLHKHRREPSKSTERGRFVPRAVVSVLFWSKTVVFLEFLADSEFGRVVGVLWQRTPKSAK